MKLIQKIIKKAPKNPIFEGLPDKLKDPKNFDDTEKRLAKIMHSDHKHKNIKEFLNCKRCQQKVHKRHEEMRKIGFDNVEQYQHWKKIMQIIINST